MVAAPTERARRCARCFVPPAIAVALLACTLALALLGARGIWDADEGRYTNVALNMLHSGRLAHATAQPRTWRTGPSRR